MGRAAPSPDEREYDEFSFNQQNLLIRRTESTYKLAAGKARLTQVKASKDKKFLALELVKDNSYGFPELKTVEYVFFKNQEGCLHRSKIVIHPLKTFSQDFDLSDEQIDFPFLYVLTAPSVVSVYSILTCKPTPSSVTRCRPSREDDQLLARARTALKEEHNLRSTFNCSLSELVPDFDHCKEPTLRLTLIDLRWRLLP